MTIDRMIELLKIEKKCVLLFSGKFREDPENSDETPTRCTRDCAHCDLVQDDDELLEMYDAVIELLKDQKAEGYWMQFDLREHATISAKCSCCGWEAHYYEDDVAGMPYCPNCGAKMKAMKWK